MQLIRMKKFFVIIEQKKRYNFDITKEKDYKNDNSKFMKKFYIIVQKMNLSQ